MAEVYVLTFPNGKQYVGRTKKTADVRFRSHVYTANHGGRSAVHSAIRKYGAESVKLTVLAQGISWQESAGVEIAWIEQLETQAPKGYNLTAGGEGVHDLPLASIERRNAALRRGDETRARRLAEEPGYHDYLSAVHKGRKLSQQTKQRMSASRTKDKLSAETLCKRSESAKRLWENPEYRAKQSKSHRRK